MVKKNVTGSSKPLYPKDLGVDFSNVNIHEGSIPFTRSIENQRLAPLRRVGVTSVHYSFQRW
ncbi:MAG: hypothetical protein L0Z50_09260, partial [Verrucomicrobiales bacterium]|nr:hypothetical protein [Verrucomicrobiales bacterium]